MSPVELFLPVKSASGATRGDKHGGSGAGKTVLDLTNANRLLNFKFRDRSRSYVRVIEAVPDFVFNKLADGERFQFRSLPEKTDEPPDENTDRFLMALEQARLSDTVYRDELNALDDDPEGEEARRIERRLKDRVRTQIGLPPLGDIKELSLTEYARLHGIDPQFDLPSKSKNDSHDKSYLQVLLLPEQMERSLSGISDQARTSIQEKGVNTLCVAFGYLEWYESDSSEKAMYAPLLLQQVEIERKLALSRYQYKIGSPGEDIDINVTLSERLARDFGLRLPSFDEEDTPESYFSKFEKIIEGRGRWRVRRFIVVGHFAFARLVMYNDIDPKLWPGNIGIVGNANILKLFAGGEGEQDSSFTAEEYEVDDPKIANKVPLLITEADSSQFSAIVDVMDKKNIAIKGPPGTGKSQTITNIIAATLAKGLRVLFVAEKMAALDVVKDRLTKTGLGDFCFELHSTKSRKKDLLASLEARLDIQNTFAAPRQLDSALAERDKLRNQLTEYVSVINKEFGISGKTIHHILWGEQRSRDDQLPKTIDQIRWPHVDALTEGDLEARRMKLDALGESHQAIIASYNSIDRHPWYGVEAIELNLFDQEDIIALANDLRVSLDAFFAASLKFNTEIGAEIVSDIAAANRITAGLNRLPTYLPEIEKTHLKDLSDPATREALREFLACWTEATNKLSALGNAEQMRAQTTGLRLLAEAVHKFGLEKQTTMSLGPFTEDLKNQADEWRRAALHGRKLLDAFGLAGDGLDLSILRRVAAAVRQLTTLPKRLLELRNDRLIQKEAGVLLEDGAKKAKTIKTALAEMEKRFTLEANEDPDALRRHAAVIRSSGLFGFIRADVRTAKRKYQSSLKTPEKVPLARMAEELDQIADVLLAARIFKLDTRLRNLCSSKFQGIDTPFGDLIRVHCWMVATDEAAEIPDKSGQQIRKVLLTQTVEKVTSLLECVEDPVHALFERVLDRSSGTEGTIEQRIDSLDTKIKVSNTAGAISTQIPAVAAGLDRRHLRAATAPIPPGGPNITATRRHPHRGQRSRSASRPKGKARPLVQTKVSRSSSRLKLQSRRCFRPSLPSCRQRMCTLQDRSKASPRVSTGM